MTSSAVDVSAPVPKQVGRDDAEPAPLALVAPADMYTQLFTRTPLAMLIGELDGTIQHANPAACALFGYAEQDLLGRRLSDLTHEDDLAATQARMVEAAAGTLDETTIEQRYLRSDGTALEVRISWALIDGAGGVRRFAAVIEDVTQQRATERALVRQTLSDPLTGLGNRLLLGDRLGHVVARQQRRPDPFALLMLDLDDFKAVNDTLGHQAGDEVLCAVAGRLRASLREGDTVARLGGDEFAVLIESTSQEHAVRVAENLLDRIREPLLVLGREFECGASVGVVTGQPGDTPERLLHDADLAMYAAKERGKGSVAAFDPSMHEAMAHGRALDAALREAIADGSLTVAYQPVVDLATGRLVGFEAVSQWKPPELGTVQRSTFLRRAEALGLVAELGNQVLLTATRQAGRWRATHPDLRDLTMSVNVSARQLTDPSFLAVVEQALSAGGLAPEHLTVEVPQSALMTGPELPALGELRALGVQLALDEFGTGLTSLQRLPDLSAGLAKIDRSLVAGIRPERPAPMAAAAAVALARSLGLQTVAVGVATADQAAFLRAHGCQRAQGRLFCRAAEAADLDPLLAAGGRLAFRPADLSYDDEDVRSE